MKKKKKLKFKNNYPIQKLNKERTFTCVIPIREIFTEKQEILINKWIKCLNEERFKKCNIFKGWDLVVENFNNKDIVYLPISNNIIN